MLLILLVLLHIHLAENNSTRETRLNPSRYRTNLVWYPSNRLLRTVTKSSGTWSGTSTDLVVLGYLLVDITFFFSSYIQASIYTQFDSWPRYGLPGPTRRPEKFYAGHFSQTNTDTLATLGEVFFFFLKKKKTECESNYNINTNNFKAKRFRVRKVLPIFSELVTRPVKPAHVLQDHSPEHRGSDFCISLWNIKGKYFHWLQQSQR